MLLILLHYIMVWLLYVYTVSVVVVAVFVEIAEVLALSLSLSLLLFLFLRLLAAILHARCGAVAGESDVRLTREKRSRRCGGCLPGATIGAQQSDCL